MLEDHFKMIIRFVQSFGLLSHHEKETLFLYTLLDYVWNTVDERLGGLPNKFQMQRAEVRARIVQRLMTKPIVVVCCNPITSANDAGNDTFHAAKKLDTTWKPGFPWIIHSHAKFQDLDIKCDKIRFIYESVDSCYYFPEHVFCNRKTVDRVHCVSSMFNCVGKVTLPMGCGTVQILPGSMVKEWSQGNGAPYHHPNTRHNHTDFMNWGFGIIKLFYNGPVDNFDLRLVPDCGY